MLLHVVRIRHNRAAEALARPGHGGDPRSDEAPGARLGGDQRQPARATEPEYELLDRTLVLGEEVALERRSERGGQVVCTRLRSRLDEEIDVDLEVARADRRLHPVPVP